MQQISYLRADKGKKNGFRGPCLLPTGEGYLRVKVADGGYCQLTVSKDKKDFLPVGQAFSDRESKWIRANKTGIFAQRDKHENNVDYTDKYWPSIQNEATTNYIHQLSIIPGCNNEAQNF